MKQSDAEALTNALATMQRMLRASAAHAEAITALGAVLGDAGRALHAVALEMLQKTIDAAAAAPVIQPSSPETGDEAAPVRGSGVSVPEEARAVDVASGPLAAAPVSPPPPAPLPSLDLRQKTPARVALLRELWFQAGVTRPEIVSRVNALPGAEITAHALWIYVLQWGIAKSARETERQAEIEARAGNPPVPPSAPVIASVKEAATRPPPARPPPPTLVTPDAARPAVAAIVSAQGPAEIRSRQYIQDWGANRGIITGKLDLDQVNAKRRHLGLAPFAVETPRYAGAR